MPENKITITPQKIWGHLKEKISDLDIYFWHTGQSNKIQYNNSNEYFNVGEVLKKVLTEKDFESPFHYNKTSYEEKDKLTIKSISVDVSKENEFYQALEKAFNTVKEFGKAYNLNEALKNSFKERKKRRKGNISFNLNSRSNDHYGLDSIIKAIREGGDKRELNIYLDVNEHSNKIPNVTDSFPSPKAKKLIHDELRTIFNKTLEEYPDAYNGSGLPKNGNKNSISLRIAISYDSLVNKYGINDNLVNKLSSIDYKNLLEQALYNAYDKAEENIKKIFDAYEKGYPIERYSAHTDGENAKYLNFEKPLKKEDALNLREELDVLHEYTITHMKENNKNSKLLGDIQNSIKVIPASEEVLKKAYIISKEDKSEDHFQFQISEKFLDQLLDIKRGYEEIKRDPKFEKIKQKRNLSIITNGIQTTSASRLGGNGV